MGVHLGHPPPWQTIQPYGELMSILLLSIKEKPDHSSKLFVLGEFLILYDNDIMMVIVLLKQ